MQEILSKFTALPNLHPLLVHFPIALVITGFGFDALSLLFRRRTWLDRAAAALYLLTAIGATVAFLTGRDAGDTVEVPPEAEMLLSAHADWAQWFLIVAWVLAATRVGIAIWDRASERVRLLPVRVTIWVAAAAAQWLIFETADRGGALVFRHGVAVKIAHAPTAASTIAPTTVRPAPAPSAETQAAPDASPEKRLIRAADGSLAWTPLPSDAAAVGKILTPLGLAGAVPEKEAAPSGAHGLALAVTGPAMLALPGEFTDVQVEATLSLHGYEGTVGLFHHARGERDAGVFRLTTQGEAALVRVRSGTEEVVHRKAVRLPSGTFTMTVSAAGSHFKGLLDKKVVSHGHHDPDPAGRVGLLLEGRGTVRVHGVRVTPLRAHH